jgi:hypothetical protein
MWSRYHIRAIAMAYPAEAIVISIWIRGHSLKQLQMISSRHRVGVFPLKGEFRHDGLRIHVAPLKE